MPSFSLVLRSLRHRDYRVYFFGQLVSLHGTWMQNVAQAWLVYRLTQSSFMLGLVSFAALLPVLLLGLFGGVVADRLPRRTLFVVMQLLAMMQALVLGVLTLGGWIRVWEIIVLAFLLGTVTAFEMPARHSMIAGLVPRADLANAIALNSSLFNVARFMGPALAGWLVAVIGEGALFLLNAASFLAVVVAISRIHVSPSAIAVRRASAGADLLEGLGFAWGHRPIRTGLLLVGLISLAGVPYMVLMPVFAQEIFAGGPRTLGLLMGAAGGGALVGALRLAQRASPQGLERLIGGAGVVGGIALAVFSRVGILGWALVVLSVVGYCLTTLVASTNAFIQTQVPDQLRGRVMSLFSVTFIGMAPIGNLIAGSLAHGIGASATVGGLGLICASGSLLFLRFAPRAAVAELPR